MRILFALLLVVGCGSVTTSELSADGGDAAAGRGGAGGSSNAAGASGSAGSGPSAGANGADAGGRGGSSNGGAGGELGGSGGAGGMACLAYNTQGFAYNVDESCGDAGRCLPSDPRCCYAHCELNGAHFIGCADNAPGSPASRCYASCSDCP